MPVLRNFEIDWAAVRARLQSGRRGAAWAAVVADALAEAEALARPAVAWGVAPVVRAEPGRLIVGEGEALESAVVASLFGRAPEVVLMVFTIGPALEARVATLGGGDPAAPFALDAAGSLAVSEAGRVGYGLIEEMAAGRRLKASIPLNPGTSHWPMSGQRVVARLAAAAEIGVEVLASDLLRPFKTIAFAVALGADVLTPADGSSCDYCDNRDLCRP